MEYEEQFNWNRVDWLYALARSEELNATAVRVGLLFGTFFQAYEREELSPSYEWIMEKARIKSRSTLSRALKDLEKAGFLHIERMHRYRSIYTFPFNGDERWKR